MGIRIGNDLLVFYLRPAVTDTEEGGLKDIDVPFLDEFGEELQEEGDDEQTDVHAVHISIRRHDHLVITQRVEAVFDVKGSLKEVELLVLIHHLLRQSEGVEGLSAQREHRLCVDIPALGDASAGRIPLGNEDGTFLFPVVLHIAVMHTAVAQLAVVQVGFLGTFTRQFRHARHRLAFPFGLLDLVFKYVREVFLVYMEIIVDVCLDEITHVLVDGFAVGCHLGGTELDLRLRLEDRFLDVHGDSRHQSVADVTVFVFAEELLDRPRDMLFEGRLVRAALRGMLPVHERIVFLSVLVGMCEGYFNVLSFHVDDGIQRVYGHVVRQEVLQSMPAEDTPSVVHDGQSRIQVSVVAEHLLHDVIMETVVLEERIVRFKVDVCPAFIRRLSCSVVLDVAFPEREFTYPAVPVALHLEMGTERIDGFHTYTVQSDALLESLGIVFSAGVQHRDGLDELALRNPAAVVADTDTQVVFHVDFDPVAGIHLELIDRVVDYFLQEHIDSVFRQLAVAQPADVHPRPGTYMLHVRQVPDVVVGIFYR